MIRLTPRQAGKVLLILAIIWLVILTGAGIYYGTLATVGLQTNLILFGSGIACGLFGFLLIKFGKY